MLQGHSCPSSLRINLIQVSSNMSSTYEIKKAYKVKKDSFLEPISPSKKKAKALKAVEYDPKKVNLPAVKMTGKPSIRAKMSEVIVLYINVSMLFVSL